LAAAKYGNFPISAELDGSKHPSGWAVVKAKLAVAGQRSLLRPSRR
jgi:hypothetical protein